MTYCIAMRLDAGLVFLSDSRTNAGIDQVSTFRKMTVYENLGSRVIVLMSSGNLSITQAVQQILAEQAATQANNIWTASTMHEVAALVGTAVRTVFERDARMFKEFGIDFNAAIIVGGQIKGETCRLFQVYSAGNFIESVNQSCYFLIGESKYGKPIVDRVVNRHTSLDEAAKCALISMDSTLRSNVSVGLPLDLLVYEADSLAVTRFVTIDENNQYFRMIRESWAKKIREVFQQIDDPVWHGTDSHSVDGSPAAARSEPVRVKPPANIVSADEAQTASRQTLAQQNPLIDPR
ncbi:peptidase [Oxalobacteraceae bacterium R-40]|uniref:Peptidase n=1 Tax=Keguizhuia sedimenti TaxID=3064264 RepID=A0ABU1BRD8_9BURK|nr:peptidase [Oxalobacteraceae bacterium R-40]